MHDRQNILSGFLSEQFGEGQHIPDTFFWTLFGLEKPQGIMEVKQVEKAQLAFMSCMDKLKSDLLEKRLVDLVSSGKSRYHIVPFQERINAAETDTRRATKKALSKGIKRLVNMPDVDNLSYTDRIRRDNALNTFDRIKHDLNRQPRYPR